jgi:hypothetical protein
MKCLIGNFVSLLNTFQELLTLNGAHVTFLKIKK